MPRLPGREPTHATLPVERAMVSSFILAGWEEERILHKKCCIRGCDHEGGSECGSNHIPAYVVWDTDIDNYVGVACSHCVQQILED